MFCVIDLFWSLKPFSCLFRLSKSIGSNFTKHQQLKSCKNTVTIRNIYRAEEYLSCPSVNHSKVKLTKTLSV